jgi:hypothetical protein
MLAWVQGEEAHLASPCRKEEERGERGILRYLEILAKECLFEAVALAFAPVLDDRALLLGV